MQVIGAAAWQQGAILFLTVSAVVRAAPRNYYTLDRSTAYEAGLAFASVYAVIELKQAFFTVGVHIV
jgi:hypothetical protein